MRSEILRLSTLRKELVRHAETMTIDLVVVNALQKQCESMSKLAHDRIAACDEQVAQIDSFLTSQVVSFVDEDEIMW